MSATATYNLKNLSNDVAKQFGFTQVTGADVTRFIFDSISTALAKDKQVRLHNFGTLVARKRAEGIARNPKTGALLKIPSRRVVKLTVAPALKKAVGGLVSRKK